MRLQMAKLVGISSSTSSTYFIDEQSIREFMDERCFKEETTTGATEMSFVPNGVKLFIDINGREYKLVLGFCDGEVPFDAGTISDETLPLGDRPLLLSGTYLNVCQAICGR